MGDITRLIESIEQGNDRRTDELFAIVYDELRSLASRKLAKEASGQTLQTTALVHEAYLRLGGSEEWSGGKHFFAAAAEAMRRILVERARQKKRLKRGGGNGQRIYLDEDLASALPPSNEVLAVHEALDELAEKYPGKAEIVKLRFFAGFTTSEAAEALEITTRTAERYWAFARAWLVSELKNRGSNST